MIDSKTIKMVDLYSQYLSIKEEIDDAIRSVIAESGYIRSRFVDAFEEEFASAVGARHCISCGNGTDALYIAMKGLGISSGDEVITTAHSWISTSETITQAGGEVVFCDTDATTFTIDSSQIESKISNRTVGIIPVHLYGQPADMKEIMRIAKKHNLWVIEDCAQAHLASIDGQMVGTFGDAATYSFYPGKNLGAMGDAGCITTNNSSLARWCELYARHGGKGEHLIEGINSRMDGLQAAILSVKLPRLRLWNQRRQELAVNYVKELEKNIYVEPPTIADGRSHVFHLFVIRTNQRNKLKSWLEEQNIQTIINYPKALPLLPAYEHRNFSLEQFPQSSADQDRILSLPLYPEMTQEQLHRVTEAINTFEFDSPAT
jgi:dTDP-4-amino-4,6-dideoxygalactose transaminase